MPACFFLLSSFFLLSFYSTPTLTCPAIYPAIHPHRRGYLLPPAIFHSINPTPSPIGPPPDKSYPSHPQPANKFVVRPASPTPLPQKRNIPPFLPPASSQNPILAYTGPSDPPSQPKPAPTYARLNLPCEKEGKGPRQRLRVISVNLQGSAPVLSRLLTYGIYSRYPTSQMGLTARATIRGKYHRAGRRTPRRDREQSKRRKICGGGDEGGCFRTYFR